MLLQSPIVYRYTKKQVISLSFSLYLLKITIYIFTPNGRWNWSCCQRLCFLVSPPRSLLKWSSDITRLLKLGSKSKWKNLALAFCFPGLRVKELYCELTFFINFFPPIVFSTTCEQVPTVSHTITICSPIFLQNIYSCFISMLICANKFWIQANGLILNNKLSNSKIWIAVHVHASF